LSNPDRYLISQAKQIALIHESMVNNSERGEHHRACRCDAICDALTTIADATQQLAEAGGFYDGTQH
jgi:hypothetical protein